jgi:hypothetical protein
MKKKIYKNRLIFGLTVEKSFVMIEREFLGVKMRCQVKPGQTKPYPSDKRILKKTIIRL